MKKRTIALIMVMSLLSVVLYPGMGHAQTFSKAELKAGQPIVVDGDEVEYFEGEGKIVAEGNVSIKYGDVTLTCDRIEVDTIGKKALCDGNVRIEHPDGVLEGEHIQYDFTQEKGEIVGGEVDAVPWFGKAEETAKVEDNEYVLRRGYVTTCDLDEPHFRLKADSISLYPDDKVVAKNVKGYIGKVPVLWFPYYYHPIIQSRAKVQLIPGRSSDWGYFLLTAWRFYLVKNTRIDILADYRSKKGFAEGVDLYYNAEDIGLVGLGSGLFRAYFVHQNDKGTYDPTPFRDEGDEPTLRKRFLWRHRVEFKPGTVGMLEFNKFSDPNFLKDYFYNEYEENNSTENYVSIVNAEENYVFSFSANKRFNDFYTVTQKLPEFKLAVLDQSLWDTPLYYSSETSTTYFEKAFAEDLDIPSQGVYRLDTVHKLSYMAKIGPLAINPYGSFRETIYGHTQRGDESDEAVARSVVSGGVDVFARFYKVFNITTNVMGIEVNGLRHIFAPGVKYFHTHQPSIDREELFQMDDKDALEKENGITLLLENKLQTKWENEDGGTESVDLVRATVSTDYFYRFKKGTWSSKDDGSHLDEGVFRNLKFDLELKPYRWMFIDSELEVTPENEAVKKGSIEAVVRPTDALSVSMGYRYEKRLSDPRNQFTFDIIYQLNPKWRLGLYERIDLQRGNIQEQQISITRDLHCWEVEFVYDVEGSRFFRDEFTLWLAFKIKAFPDLQLGLSRSFSKRSPGRLEPGTDSED
ncbi:MAG: LPS assembly protein LptD [Candidatus Omnitrophica bacterium]|nr:LPS assembly protein LptD [Candidatus Omnitrophota bacterium]